MSKTKKIINKMPLDYYNQLQNDLINHPENLHVNLDPAFNTKDNSQPAKPFKHHQQLLHGTQNFSILPILSKGLLDAKTLHQHTSSYYQYTGSGLGNGIYFAKPTESLKPAHYTGHYSNYEENHYLILADIGYNSSKTVSQYDNYSHQADLVHAIGVGSGNRDEFLVNQVNQIQLQYVISITHR